MTWLLFCFEFFSGIHRKVIMEDNAEGFGGNSLCFEYSPDQWSVF